MKYRICIALFLCSFLLISCQKQGAEPTTVTLWHVYGGQTSSPLTPFIDEFNDTIGLEQNIRVEVTSVSNTNMIHEGVLAAANGQPGATALPDMFISYPKTVMALPDQSILVDYTEYFTEDELSEFVPSFLEEGYIDDKLYVLPVAKSTEVIFCNKTFFDRFATDTGASLDDLSTWEGLYELAEKYYEWSGKAFFSHDYHFDYFQVGVTSLGEDFFDGDSVVFNSAFKRVWQPYARAALSGGVWLHDGYGTDPHRTGDIVVSVGSSASVLYYPMLVTYDDNTSEDCEFVVLPAPIFEGGDKVVMQRGAGMCVVKSTAEREEACVTFLKWLTDAQTNVEFVTTTGYMPVKTAAFDEYLPQALDDLDEPVYRSLYEAFIKMQDEYTFYTAPQMSSYLTLETNFESLARQTLSTWRSKVGLDDTSDIDSLVWDALDEFEVEYSNGSE